MVHLHIIGFSQSHFLKLVSNIIESAAKAVTGLISYIEIIIICQRYGRLVYINSIR